MEAKNFVRLLVTGAGLFCVAGAIAEDTVIIKQPASVVPSVTTITKKTTVAPIVNEIVQTGAVPAVISPLPVTVKQSSSSSSTMVENVNPLPEFERRLTLMKEQIDLGLSKGWLSVSQADIYKSRLVDLTAMKDRLKSQAFDRILSDSIEKQLTGLNIEISDSLKSANDMMIGSPPEVLK